MPLHDPVCRYADCRKQDRALVRPGHHISARAASTDLRPRQSGFASPAPGNDDADGATVSSTVDSDEVLAGLDDEGVACARSGATAIKRVELSRPVRLALDAGLIREGDDVFDYGCGYGTDVALLEQIGYQAAGWDPVHRSGARLRHAAVVNLGYVLNVIPSLEERTSTLQAAWGLAQNCLVVAVRTTSDLASISRQTPHSDGLLTGGETFQKLYTQVEAREYLTTVLDRPAIPLGVGVYVVFKTPADEQSWLERRSEQRRSHRALRLPRERRRSRRDALYVEHHDTLQQLEQFLAEHGRLPHPDERPWTAEVEEALGSLPRAFQVIRHAAEEPWWEEAADARRGELTERFALARLRRRPKFTDLPTTVQRDVKALFGSYKQACAEADELLFSIGSQATLSRAARSAPVGKVTAEAIYAHVDAVPLWPAELRILISAAEAILGGVAGATIIKAHLNKPRVSWLVYPDFDTDPHPALAASWVVDLRELDVRPFDYRERQNPPVLHRKELFVAEDHPRRATFERLTRQEERHGLLDAPASIGTLRGWQDRLNEAGWTLRGHRLVRSRDATEGPSTDQ